MRNRVVLLAIRGLRRAQGTAEAERFELSGIANRPAAHAGPQVHEFDRNQHRRRTIMRRTFAANEFGRAEERNKEWRGEKARRYPGLCTATSAMSFSREPHRRPRWRPWSASEPQPRARYPSSGHSCCETLRPRDAIWLHSRGVRPLLCVLDWACGSPVVRGISGLPPAASIVFTASAFVVFNEWN